MPLGGCNEAIELPATKSELLELARLMERYPETFVKREYEDDDTEFERPVRCDGITDDMPEWGIIIACLRIAAAT